MLAEGLVVGKMAPVLAEGQRVGELTPVLAEGLGFHWETSNKLPTVQRGGLDEASSRLLGTQKS